MSKSILTSSELDDLAQIVRDYKGRKFDEDLQTIRKYGGLQGLCEKIKTDYRLGLSATSVEDLQK